MLQFKMSASEDNNISHKQHRERNAGRKAEKKQVKRTKTHKNEDSKQKNPKAFTFNSTVKAERRFRRKQDINTKRQHIPVVDRTPLEPPPILVAVVGPPKVGKSLVIQCLIKSYTKHPLINVIGPVTLVSSKRRRITFIECNNDINSMIDIAKVADLVLLLIDASFGFEMEIFEFLNICQVHGMPRIMGILTHLDMIKNSKQMRKTKKILKQRFWTEVYSGAKLFYLSGLLHDEYLRMEIKNLARFISVMKFRPLTWRTTHPYLLVDRIEDLTDPEIIRQNSKIDRVVSVYGYIRGVPLNKQSSIHIPGCGDLKIKDISFLPDPCPLPEHLKKRALVEKERLIYAPFSGVGGIVYDKDAVYVELGGSHSHKKDDTGLLSQLFQTQETLDHKLEQSELQFFTDSTPLKSQDVKEIFTEQKINDGSRIRRKVIFNDTENFKNDNIDGNDNDKETKNEMDIDDKSNSNIEEMNNNNFNQKFDLDLKNEIEESNELFQNKISQTKKRKLIDKSSAKKIKLDSSIDDRENMNYHELHINEDKKIKEKISETLCLLTNENLKKCRVNEENHNDAFEKNCSESFDDLSEDENINFNFKLENEINQEKRCKNQNDNENKIENENEGNIKNSHEEGDNKKQDKKEDTDGDLKWKINIVQKAREAFLNRQQTNVNVMKLVYGIFDEKNLNQCNKPTKTKDIKKNIGEIFQIVQIKEKEKCEIKNQEESVFFCNEFPENWLEEKNKAVLLNCFVTGKWKESEDAEELLKLDDIMEEEQEVYDDFEDLETGQKQEEKNSKEINVDEMTERKNLLEKKKKLKEQFNTEYDTGDRSFYEDLKLEVERQTELNKTEFESLDDEVRVTLEGFRPGMYVRLEIGSVPCELITNLDPSYPMILGGLLPGEENIGYVQTRIKKHRWYSKILKSKDPLILSIGWRRFQSLVIFSKLEDNLRNRMLKYTPEHVACMAHFWGPITPQGTGILAVQNITNYDSGFRIAATGTITELDKSCKVVKKLKLTGIPYKIYKKTAFIKNMFNSLLEVAKFEGAKIKTVSGIRGQIKKAVSKPEGCFRATFEDKLQLSDIVFCRTWFSVNIPKFYNPVISLLLPSALKNEWTGMKTTGQLKREFNIRATANPDHFYTPVEREPKIFKKFVIPRKLQKELPYKDKPKSQFLSDKKRNKLEEKRIAVVREPKEHNIAKLMKMIRTNYEYKQEKLKEATHKRIITYQKKVNEEEAKKLRRQKELKKQVFRDLSKLEIKKKKKEL